MTGAQACAQACTDKGVAALFCCPGNDGVVHALAGVGVPTFSGRHERSMTRAADAFIRVTGETAVASGTEGPGFTDMICGIACATAARTPLLGVACHVSIQQGDTEAGIQEWRAARRCWLKGKRWLKAGTRVRFPPTAVSIDGP